MPRLTTARITHPSPAASADLASGLPRRRAALGALGSLTALTLAACGGGSDSTATTSTGSSNTAISGLSLSAGTLVPAFAPATLAYTAAVAYSTTGIAFTPTLSDSSASLRIGSTVVTSGQTSGAFALNVGNNTFTLTVTATDGSSRTYTLVVARASANISAEAELLALSISTGILAPAFSSAVTSYATTVGNAVSSVTLGCTASPNASIQVNGSTVSNGGSSGALALNVGSNTLTIEVTAEDGVTRKTTTVTVVRATVSATANATLAALSISAGSLSPAFVSGTVAYTASVPNGTSSLTLTPTATDAAASIVVNGSGVASGAASAALALAVGLNTLTVVVSSSDGSTTSTYTVAVTRAAAVSNLATLASMALSTGTLAPAFSSDVTSYSVALPNAVSALSLTLTATSSAATVRLNGAVVASGASSGAQALAVGANTLSVVVTAQDGTTTRTYTLIATRAAANLSAVATLASLGLSSGSLVPAFASATTAYTVAVDNSVETLTVTPVSTQAAATVKVNSATVQSGMASAAQPLAVGSNTVVVEVTAQDAATVVAYTLGITRAAAGSGICPAGVVPEETAGPYPADGSSASNATYNVLGLSGIVRSDIRYTLGSSTPVSGVPLTVRITLVNLSANCAPLAGYGIYLWHCTPSGVYSVYTENSVASNYLRGVQATGSTGLVSFTTVVPGCYSGRMPHMHFEIYRSLAQATSASNKIRTSQLAFPTATMQAVYAAASGYANSVANLANISFATDNVFNDGYSLEMVTMTGNATDGYVASVTVAIAV